MSPQAFAKTIRTLRRVAATAVGLAIVCVLMLAAPARAWEFDISGPTVAFMDNSDIWLYDLDTRQYRQATATPEDSEQSPTIAGQRTYFSRPAPFESPDILDAYDIPFGHLDRGIAGYYWLTGLSGDAGHLVFAASQSTGFSPQAVYVLDAAGASPPERISPTEPESLLTPTEGRCVRHPDIAYPWVVWTDVDRLDCNQSPGWLYAMNLETNAIQTVARPSCSTCSTGVSEGKVALVEREDDYRVLVTYDLASGARTVHSTPTEPSYGIMDFRDSRIVYSDASLSTGQWIYDLTTGEATLVTTPDDQEGPYSGGRLSGNWIVYSAQSNAQLVAKNLQSGEKRVIRPRPNDRDGDGFGDADDQCPDVAGSPPNGCPPSNPAAPGQVPPPSNSGGTPSNGDGFTVRAIGDSVTAGFGYNGSGRQIPKHQVVTCLLGNLASNACQSPQRISYPAIWAQMIGVPRRQPFYANYAKSGSTPKDWVERGGRFNSELNRVITDDPDVVLMTLGANPLLQQFLMNQLGRVCMLEITGELTRWCIRRKLAKNRTIQRLVSLYVYLLDNSNARIGIFLYHKTYPETITRSKADILFSELNSAVATAFAIARKERPDTPERLKLLRPPKFDGHQCNSRRAWILNTDACIHPNAIGHRHFARVINSQLFPGGIPR